jgi:hypothetical protein
MSEAATSPNTTTRAGRLLHLLRGLIDYARELTAAYRQRGAGPDTSAFGTSNIRLILARIARGLLRAQALEALILSGAACLDPEPPCYRAERLDREPRDRPRAARPAARPADDAASLLAGLPTAEQIADEVRRRPVTDVIIDICCDLGILPNHPLFHEIRVVLFAMRGNLAVLLRDMADRGPDAFTRVAPPPPRLAPSPAPAATGPP